MRTDQQGYLQRLGFRDADRNSSHHDMVCLFLADKKNSRKMAEYIYVFDSNGKNYTNSYS